MITFNVGEPMPITEDLTYNDYDKINQHFNDLESAWIEYLYYEGAIDICLVRGTPSDLKDAIEMEKTAREDEYLNLKQDFEEINE